VIITKFLDHFKSRVWIGPHEASEHIRARVEACVRANQTRLKAGARGRCNTMSMDRETSEEDAAGNTFTKSLTIYDPENQSSSEDASDHHMAGQASSRKADITQVKLNEYGRYLLVGVDTM
jgi:hypothetical protein